MLYDTTPFDVLRKAYARRLAAASILIAIAAACGGVSYAGLADDRWLTLILLGCSTGMAAFMLGLDLSQRWQQLRQLHIVERASRVYGDNPTTSRGAAASDLGRNSRH